MIVVVREYLERISGFHRCGDMEIAASVTDAGAPPTTPRYVPKMSPDDMKRVS